MDMQTQTHGCPHCNRIFQQSEAPEEPEPVCESCRYLYPPALLKAAGDYFDYALRLSTGEIIRFVQPKFTVITPPFTVGMEDMKRNPC